MTGCHVEGWDAAWGGGAVSFINLHILNGSRRIDFACTLEPISLHRRKCFS